MKFERFRVDEKMRTTGDMLHFVLPYYTKTKIKIINKFSSMIFQGKRPIDSKISYEQINILIKNP